MSNLLHHRHLAKLDSLTNCPVCGAKRRLAYGGRKARRVIFECEASFVCDPNTEIRAMMPCPAPSELAANLLNHELIEEDASQSQAGAA